MATVHDTKVDITAVNMTDQNNVQATLVCLNFNIPKLIQENAQQFQQILSDISAFLENNFMPDNEISFQVTASYYLRNRITGEERLWTGSFFPGNQVSLSGNFFHLFRPQTFSQRLQQFTTPNHVQFCFLWNHLPTEWAFAGVASFIVNTQVKVGNNHAFLRQYDLQAARRRRMQRRHVILPHPW